MRLTYKYENSNDYGSIELKNLPPDPYISRYTRFELIDNAFQKIRTKLGQIEDILEEFNINDINELRTCLENERKGTKYFEDWWNKRFEELLKPKVEVLKIIKEKEVDIWAIKYCSSLKQYNCKEDGRARLTQEEYDLLRKELL